MSPAPLYVLVFAAALLVNGALLALVEPIALKTILPRLRTPTEWGAFIAFFQLVPLVGCAYALAVVRLFRARRQAALHLALLAVLLMWWGFGTAGEIQPIPLVHVPGWWLANEGGPVVAGLFLCQVLLIGVGVPLAALTGCIPLLQCWFAETGQPLGRDPYFLYAPWCLGCLAGSLAYPILVEPYLTVAQQGRAWLYACGFAAALTAGCVALLWRSKTDFPPRPEPQPAPAPEPESPPPAPEALWPPAVGAALRRLHWVALSAVPVALGLALVNYVSAEVSAIPLFWLLAAVPSLLTLILAFARQPLFARLPARVRLAVTLVQGMGILACLFGLWLNRPGEAGAQPGPLATGLWLILIPLALLMPRALAMVVQPAAALLLIFGLSTRVWVLPELATHLLAVFVAMRCCHSELARERPPPEGLAGYFLCMAFGATLGGLFAGVLAPVLFPNVEEYGLTLALACMLRPGSARNGLSDWLLARGLCALWQCGREAARLTRFKAALVMDWLYPLLVGVVTVRLWLFGGPLAHDPALYALPLALCLLAVRRPVRFGLCLAAVLLARPLAPGPSESAAVTLLPGFGGPQDDSLLLTVVLLPLAAGTVAVLASLLSLLLTDDREAPA